MVSLLDLPPDIWRTIALTKSLAAIDILNFMRSNRRIYNSIIYNDDFWLTMIQNRLTEYTPPWLPTTFITIKREIHRVDLDIANFSKLRHPLEAAEPLYYIRKYTELGYEKVLHDLYDRIPLLSPWILRAMENTPLNWDYHFIVAYWAISYGHSYILYEVLPHINTRVSELFHCIMDYDSEMFGVIISFMDIDSLADSVRFALIYDSNKLLPKLLARLSEDDRIQIRELLKDEYIARFIRQCEEIPALTSE